MERIGCESGGGRGRRENEFSAVVNTGLPSSRFAFAKNSAPGT